MDTPTLQEIELKLVVLGLTGEAALHKLRRSPSLARRQPLQQWLDNRYFDTPDGLLQQHRCALRLRQTRSSAAPSAAGDWVQTFKTAGHNQGGLSQRGEWETALGTASLDRAALQGTAWDALDPADQWFARLQLRFQTRCLRTTWQVRRRDGTHIEVALDAGHVLAQGQEADFVELELELRQGPAQALFELAAELAARLPCLPSNRSKAERGQALWADRLYEPVKASKPLPQPGQPLALLATRAIADMLDQFLRNLDNLMHHDAPELIHQARVGWRRWRSLQQLLRPWWPALPDLAPLRPLLDALGQQRNLDVACTQTLPAWAASWSGDASAWHDSLERLQNEQARHRHHLRACLAQPATGLLMLELAHQLWTLNQQPPLVKKREAVQRLARWHRRLHRLLHNDGQVLADVASLHQARLLAKRLRYGSEALADALSAKKQRRLSLWLGEAQAWQTRIGEARDAWQAGQCLQALGAADAVVYFFKGIGAAMDRSAQERAMQSP
jgi:inorganic triphosphatase YgiF